MLGDFLRINLPYGMVKTEDKKWMLYNREYLPLGWTDTSNPWKGKNDWYKDFPVHIRYKGLTDNLLKKLAHSLSAVRYDDDGKVNQIWFYDDATNPHSFPKQWDAYAIKLQILSKLKTITVR